MIDKKSTPNQTPENNYRAITSVNGLRITIRVRDVGGDQVGADIAMDHIKSVLDLLDATEALEQLLRILKTHIGTEYRIDGSETEYQLQQIPADPNFVAVQTRDRTVN